MSPTTTYLCMFALAVVGCAGCRMSPEAKEARFLRRGQALMAQKDYSRAILEFRNAATVRPRDAEAYYQLGMASLISADPASAAGSFQRETGLNPKHLAAQLKLAEL